MRYSMTRYPIRILHPLTILLTKMPTTFPPKQEDKALLLHRSSLPQTRDNNQDKKADKNLVL